jgi:hypothetical protein
MLGVFENFTQSEFLKYIAKTRRITVWQGKPRLYGVFFAMTG